MSANNSLQILTLKQIPTSLQLIDCYKSIQKISPLDVQSQQFKAALKQYAEQHLMLYKSSSTLDGQNLYACFLTQQRLDNQYYIDQTNQQILRIQPLQHIIIQRKQSPNLLDAQQLKSIKLLKQKLDIYLNSYFSKPNGSTCTNQLILGHFKIQANKIQEITIGLTNKNYNSICFYSGEWTSYWKLKRGSLEGRINVKNHYYENGNVMFQRSKGISKNWQKESELDLNNFNQEEIVKVIKLISSEQSLYQKELQQLFAKRLVKSLKKLRRISPLTQGKMIWNVNAVQLSQGLKAKNQLQQ